MNKPTRLAMFGGTFDPLHNTHLDIARTALAHAHLDTVLFVVAGQPPHKKTALYASPEDRYAMVCAALDRENALVPSRIEIDRPGPSYTRDTLRALRAQHPGAALFLIIGLDSLLDLPHWNSPDEILTLAKLLVVPRPGQGAHVPAQLQGRFELLPFTETPISSTEIRNRIAAGEPFSDLVPPPVECYIRQKNLYHALAPHGAH